MALTKLVAKLAVNGFFLDLLCHGSAKHFPPQEILRQTMLRGNS